MSGPQLEVIGGPGGARDEPRADPRRAVVGYGASSKIRDHHRDRLAIVYVRQSSPQQVLENRESRERQYALAEFAQQLGWPGDRVLLIDEDQGLSGKFAANRSGFQRLLSEVAMNHVGLVLGLELSRLSRSNKDWHHLVEVCAVFHALLGDQDGLYDANDSNDRLLLGMKGAMSEFELTTLRNRLERGRENKAQRGELFPHVPLGYWKCPTGEVTLEPDEQAQAVVRLIFEKFEELGTAWAVFRYLVRHQIQLGIRSQRGPHRGGLEWRCPQPARILAVLRHPMYAGAYVYGQHRPGRRNPATGRREGGQWWLPLDKIRIVLRDRLPAYITWEQYLANQERLSQNRFLPTSRGAPRRGEALLAGLVACGKCGRRMRVRYRDATRPFYVCDGNLREGGEQSCCTLSARPLDELVARQVLHAVEPAALELSLGAAQDIERERKRLHGHWRRRLERACYEAQRVERQFQAVEPENRLVARTLESRWEEALRQERQLREEYDRFQGGTPPRLSDAECAKIRGLTRDLASLWQSSEMTPAERKEVLRCLIERVVVHVQRSEHTEVALAWQGGFSSRHEILRPVGTYTQLRDYQRLSARIKELHRQGCTVPAIAAQLNDEGFATARRRCRFNVGSLAPVMKRLGLTSMMHQAETLKPDEWRVRDLARELQVLPQAVYYWAKQNWIHSRRTPGGRHWIVWADQDELKRLRQLKPGNLPRKSCRAPHLTTPKPRVGR